MHANREPPTLTEELLARLRARAADPTRRVDQRPTVFSDRLDTLDLGRLLHDLRRVGFELRAVVAANQAGRVDAATAGRVDALASDLATPIDRPAVAPASVASLELAEEDLGFALPADLRRLYLEVGDGGFGPSTGLMPIADVVRRYRSVAAEAPRTRRWPDRLLPLVDDGSGIDALDASVPVGAIRSWDPEGLSEHAGDRAWRRSFADVAPSLAAWLDGWLGARSPDGIRAEMMRKAMVEPVKASRAGFGLPEAGGEEQPRGHPGLNEEDLR